MENFPDSLFPFLIIVAVVGLRVVSAIRRGRHDRRMDGNAPARAAPPRAARGFVPWEDEFRDDASPDIAGNDGPAQAAPDDDDEAFSAWNLSVDDAPPPPRPPQAPGPVPRAATAGLFRVPEAPQPDRFAAASADLPRSTETPGPVSQAVPARSAPAPRPAQRFHGLSALQRGVVWAEILGAPKGLRG